MRKQDKTYAEILAAQEELMSANDLYVVLQAICKCMLVVPASVGTQQLTQNY